MENMHTDVRVERVNPLYSGIFRTLVITSKLELQEFVHISVFFHSNAIEKQRMRMFISFLINI